MSDLAPVGLRFVAIDSRLLYRVSSNPIFVYEVFSPRGEQIRLTHYCGRDTEAETKRRLDVESVIIVSSIGDFANSHHELLLFHLATRELGVV